MQENSKLEMIKQDVMQLAYYKKYNICPQENMIEFCMHIWQVNPVYMSCGRRGRENDEVYNYVNLNELIDIYCKAGLDNNSELFEEMMEQARKQFNEALIQLYGDRVNEWWDEGLNAEYEPDYDDMED
jgi:hypothetical protein